jgi:FkbM family methyltransferase
VHRCSDKWVGAAQAFLGALRGLGAGTGVECEALCATRFVSPSTSRPTIIDAGANVGDWYVAMSRLLYNKPLIYMFEPLPAARKVAASRACPGSEILPFALGNQIEERELLLSHDLDTTASFYPRKDSVAGSREYRGERIKVVTLDHFLTEKHIQRVDFLKMDLEGNELAALKGAKEASATKIILALSFEFGSSNLNSRTFFYDLFHLLTSHSYKIARMSPTGRLIPITYYTEDLEFFARTSTYFASLE